MLFEVPLTNYQVKKIKFYMNIVVITALVIIIIGNIITSIVKDSVTISENSYILKHGFPLFNYQQEYIKLIKNYPYDPGVKLQIHRLSPGQSYWDISLKYNISINTLIAANPFLNSFIAHKDIEIVVPSENGVLFAFDDVFDVWRMKKRLNYKGKISGEYLPTIFKIFSTDDIRFVFFKNAKPVIVNNSIEMLYSLKNIFMSPIKGYYSSLFGARRNSIYRRSNFHNGVDIMSKRGTPIRPARKGIVTYTGWRGGYGKTIIIQHHDGYATLYGHCSAIKIKKGRWVTKNDIIGLVGSTGRSTGPHLHFTVMRHGNAINPLLLIW